MSMLLLALRFARSIRGIGAARPIPEGQPASVDTAQSYPFGPATAAVVEAMPSTISEELKRGERQSVARVTVHAFSKHQSEPQHEGCAVHPHCDEWDWTPRLPNHARLSSSLMDVAQAYVVVQVHGFGFCSSHSRCMARRAGAGSQQSTQPRERAPPRGDGWPQMRDDVCELSGIEMACVASDASSRMSRLGSRCKAPGATRALSEREDAAKQSD